MRSRLISGLLTCMLSSALLAQPDTPDTPSLQQAIQCIQRNAPTRSFSATLEVITDDPSGQSVPLRLSLLGRRVDMNLQLKLRVTAPSDLAGTAVLLQQHDGRDLMALYLPALGKTKQITGAMAAQELWGTSFSYLDLKQLLGGIVQGQASWSPERHLDAHRSDLIHVTPSDELGLPYERIDIWVSQQYCLPIAIDLIGGQQRLLKTLRADLTQIADLEGRYLATRWISRDIKMQRRSQARLSDLRYDQTIDPKEFEWAKSPAAP